MKYLTVLLAIITLFSCSENESPSNSNLLKRVESCVNGESEGGVLNLTYEAEQLIAIEKIDDFSITKWEIKKQGEIINELVFSNKFASQNTTNTITYQVTYDNNQISLVSDTENSNNYSLTHTDNYVDNFKAFLGSDSEVVYESIFLRNEENQIDSISYYANYETDTILVYQYDFPSFITDFSLPDSFNPVYYYSFSLYEPYIGMLLGLKISKNPPSKSSLLYGTGEYQEEFIIAQLAELDGGQVQKLDYSISDLPSNSYSLKFFYE